MITILFLAADPTDESRLRLGEEVREIQEKLQLAKLRDNFVLHQRFSVRPADISQALLDLSPQIVHFSGHGTTNGAICVEDLDGKTHPIQAEDLAALFEQFSKQVNCVILNACYSEAQARAIGRYIDNVIGMNQAVGDKAAIVFSIGLYQALGAGRLIGEAYKLGCVQLRLQGIPEHLNPILVSKGSSVEMPFPLIRRLEADTMQVRNLVQKTPAIQIVQTEGNPPTKYLLRYIVDGIVGVNEDESPRTGQEHLVEMILHADYPMSLPFIRFSTPIFHPNIFESGNVCMGWFRIPYELTDVCIHLAKMIDYQIYNLSSPANLRAANWAKTHSAFFPLTHWSLADPTPLKDEPVMASMKMVGTKRETINVDVVITRTGDRYTVEVALDSLVRYTEDKLIEALKLPLKLENGWAIAYHLYNKSTSQMLDNSLTFRQNDVKDGDTLSFHIETMAG